MVTASDASGQGGGATCSADLTSRGRSKIEEVRGASRQAPADGLLRVEHCAGIGAARRALEHLGVRPEGYIATETDEAAQRVLTTAWPGVHLAGDLEDFNLEEQKRGNEHMNEVKHVLEVAGTPCQDLSGANVQGTGLSGSKSCLFFTLESKSSLYQKAFPRASVKRALEDVFSMSEEDRRLISRGFSGWTGPGRPQQKQCCKQSKGFEAGSTKAMDSQFDLS